MSQQLSSLIIEYAKSLPAWQKILAKAAFDYSGDISKAPEIDSSIHRLLKESNLSQKVTGEEEIAFIEALAPREAGASESVPQLIEVSNFEHVNALSDGQKIVFAPKLTIIYGENGSGKSGYSRLLNSSFYSRGDKSILPNIRKPKHEHGKPKANFQFLVEGTKKPKVFPDDLSSSEFSQFACFDSKTVPVHIGSSNELYVMPKEMDFFERLAQLINFTSKKLNEYIEQNNKPNTFSQLFDGESEIKTIISQINENTDFTKLMALVGDTEQAESQLRENEKTFHELKATDPKKTIEDLNKSIEECAVYKGSIGTVFEKCSDVAVQTAKETWSRFQATKQAVTKTGIDSFKNEFLATTGSESWRKFIEHSSKVLVEEGTQRQREFPIVGDSCPLCLQKLEVESINLFKRYFDFLSGNAEKEYVDSKKALVSLAAKYSGKQLPGIMSNAKLNYWLEINDPENRKRLIQWEEDLESFHKSMSLGLQTGDFSPLTSFQVNELDEKIEEILKGLNGAKEAFDEVEFAKRIKEVVTNLTGLRHRIKLNELESQIAQYINLLKWNSEAKKVSQSITTKPVTDKQKKIFEEHFTKQYRELFYKEAERLKVNFQVDVKQRGQAGKTLRKLDVLSYSPAEVLSEGEQRAIALADFLTEVEICNIKGGIIFDDPVNSLDHERKTYIASRLVAESHIRQVIVFTHDISFLFDLVNEAERQKLKDKEDLLCHWIQKIDSAPGFVNLGLRKELEIDYKTHTRAEEFWQKSRSENNPEQKELLAKQGFDCLRKTYEAFILTELFGDTVRRFDRRIKYDTLKKVYCPPDVATFVCDRLAYCSGFVSGHLAADGYSGEAATPELLKREMDAFVAFRKTYKEQKEATFAGVGKDMIVPGNKG